MPTGYTDRVASGEVTTLKEFAYICARGMNALVSMRDSSFDAPIPEKFEPSSYNREYLEEAQIQLDELRLMSPKQLRDHAIDEYEEQLASDAVYERSKSEQRSRYRIMLAQVREWQGAPQGIQKFMMEQLNTSIEHDCPEEPFRWKKDPVLLSAEDWFAKQERSILNDIAYHSKAYDEELERVEERNKWVKQLRESLGDA